MNTKKVVTDLMNPEYLSNIIGQDVRPTSVRVKPDTSVVVGHKDADNNHGWARVLWPGSVGKAHKIAARAAKTGLNTNEFNIAGGMVFQHGPALADPKLIKHIAKAGIADSARVLRYNPERRLVVKNGDHVTRIMEKAATFSVGMYEEIAQYIPVPARLDSGRRPHRTELEFLGQGDLTDPFAMEEYSYAAGVMLWQLHSAPIECQCAPDYNPADAHNQMRAHVELLSIMAPEFVNRLAAINEKLESLTGPSVMLHGDLSPDQYLYGDGLWLTDFDRLHCGPAIKDLGSYLATSTTSAGEQFLQGYASVARSMPADHEIRMATAHAMVLRIADPLRKASQTWHDDIAANLDQIEQVIA